MLGDHRFSGETTLPLKRLRSDRRFSERLTLPVRTEAHLEELRRSQRVWVINVSPDGLGLLATASVAAGAVVAVRIRPPANPGGGVVLSARVAHCTPQAEGEWHVGCELLDPAALEQALPYLLPAPGGAAPDGSAGPA
jgi:hypothetical protein